MFVAAIIAFVVFFMNMGNVAELFSIADSFNGYMLAINEIITTLGLPLILFTLGLIAMLLPRPDRKDKQDKQDQQDQQDQRNNQNRR